MKGKTNGGVLLKRVLVTTLIQYYALQKRKLHDLLDAVFAPVLFTIPFILKLLQLDFLRAEASPMGCLPLMLHLKNSRAADHVLEL